MLAMDRLARHGAEPWPAALTASDEPTDRDPAPSRGVAALLRAWASVKWEQPFAGHVTAFALLHQGHKVLAVAVGFPLYVPYLLWHLRRARAQAEALTRECRAWRRRGLCAQQRQCTTTD